MSVWQVLGQLLKKAAKSAAKNANSLVKDVAKTAVSQPLDLSKSGSKAISLVKKEGLGAGVKQLGKEVTKGVVKQVSAPLETLKGARDMGRSILKRDAKGFTQGLSKTVSPTSNVVSTGKEENSGASTNTIDRRDTGLWSAIGNILSKNNSNPGTSPVPQSAGAQEGDLTNAISDLPIQAQIDEQLQQAQQRKITSEMTEPIAEQTQGSQPLANQSSQAMPLGARKIPYRNTGYLY